MKSVEFFYDITCPYAYLASTQIDIVAARANAEVIYKPFLLGGLLRDIGQPTALLDNMTPAAMGELLPGLRAAGAASARRSEGHYPFEVEASGGIDLTTIAAVAACGVDRISVGALTHSAPALDLSLYLEPLESSGAADAHESAEVS